ncbi:MAG: FtsX-like permease family protein [Azospirillaceae bacterium]
MTGTLGMAARLARRELRGGLKGFRVFLACLTLGVAAIATVNSVAQGVLTGLEEDGRAILGGDVALRKIYQPAEPDQVDYLESVGAVSRSAEMRAMARGPDADATALVELKAVDGAYPLYGSVELGTTLDGIAPGDLDAALAERDGVWGAAVDPLVLDRLGLAVGDRMGLGEGTFAIRATVEYEPDRAGSGGFTLGPRVMIAEAALEATGLVRPGSMIYYHYRLALDPGMTVEQFRAALGERFPQAGWRVTDFTDASPQLAETIQRLALFLTLVGLTALLVGGVGVGNAVKAYLDGRIATIATFKCLGAPSRLVFATYLLQILALAGLGTVVGLIVGALAPYAVSAAVADLLPIRARIGLYPGALALAAGFGLLTALTFSLWPLARARAIPAAGLFRQLVAPSGGLPPAPYLAGLAVAAAALAGLAIVTAVDRVFAVWFVLGAIATLLTFRAAAWLAMDVSRRVGRPRRPGLRLALANLYRPGAPTPTVVLSLGLGLTVLIAVALIEGNMSRQVQDEIPEAAPAFFFVDIQPDQIGPFTEAVEGIEGTGTLEEVPSLRGRIVAANGEPAAEALQDPEYSWLLEGDRGVTYRATPRAADRVIAGDWWAQDYAGPPLLSIYRDIGTAFGIGVGDTLTINVLGRDVTAEIANMRVIDWSSLSINFTLVFSPQPLASAPHTFIATIDAEPSAEPVIQRMIAQDFPNVTAVRVRDALDAVNSILSKIGTAVRSTAAITILAGTLVLAGAIAAGHRRRVYDSVVLKVLGATRGDILRAFGIEYGLLGVLTAIIATIVGTATAWAVLTFVMNIDWVFMPGAVAVTALLCTAITLAFGFVGTWRALGQKAAPLLRNE